MGKYFLWFPAATTLAEVDQRKHELKTIYKHFLVGLNENLDITIMPIMVDRVMLGKQTGPYLNFTAGALTHVIEYSWWPAMNGAIDVIDVGYLSWVTSLEFRSLQTECEIARYGQPKRKLVPNAIFSKPLPLP